MAKATAPAASRLPFQLFTREIPEFLQNVPSTNLGAPRQTVELDNVGYSNLILLNLKGTITVATATLVLLPLMPWNLLMSVIVQPPGLIPPVNVSGWSLHIWDLVGKFFAPFVDGADFPGQNLDTNAFDGTIVNALGTSGSLVVGTNNVSLWWAVPFARSSMDVRGIIPLGTRQRVNLSFSLAAASDLCTVPGNVTGSALSVDVYQLYYPASPIPEADPDTSYVVTYEELSQPISATGTQTVNIEPGQTILGIAHGIVCNSSQDSADVDTLTFRVNKSYYLNQLPSAGWWFVQRRRMGFPLPAGTILYDFDRFVDDGALDPREWVHSSDVQSIVSQPHIATGATLGTSPRIITTVRRLVDLRTLATG